MKKIFILFALSLFLAPVSIQVAADDIQFEYDDAGNCVLKRKTVVLRNSKSFAKEEEAQVEWMERTEILVLPNPTKGMLSIELRGETGKEPFRLKLLNTSGRTLHESTFHGRGYTVNMTGYPAGIYILQLIRGKESKEWKIIKE